MRYGAVDGGGKDTVSIAGGGTTESTISVSTTTTAYYVQVAAVNSAGIGIYSEPVFQEQALQSMWSFQVKFNQVQLHNAPHALGKQHCHCKPFPVGGSGTFQKVYRSSAYTENSCI